MYLSLLETTDNKRLPSLPRDRRCIDILKIQSAPSTDSSVRYQCAFTPARVREGGHVSVGVHLSSLSTEALRIELPVPEWGVTETIVGRDVLCRAFLPRGRTCKTMIHGSSGRRGRKIRSGRGGREFPEIDALT